MIKERKLRIADTITREFQSVNYVVTLNGVKHELKVVRRRLPDYEYFVNGVKQEVDDAEFSFRTAVGMTEEEIIKYYDEIRYRKMDLCCKKNLNWVNGYPGEMLLICSVCGKISDTKMDYNAII